MEANGKSHLKKDQQPIEEKPDAYIGNKTSRDRIADYYEAWGADAESVAAVRNAQTYEEIDAIRRSIVYKDGSPRALARQEHRKKFPHLYKGPGSEGWPKSTLEDIKFDHENVLVAIRNATQEPPQGTWLAVEMAVTAYCVAIASLSGGNLPLKQLYERMADIQSFYTQCHLEEQKKNHLPTVV